MAYSKQTWDTASYVNPTRMNHIEQGIYDVEQSIPQRVTIPSTNFSFDSTSDFFYSNSVISDYIGNKEILAVSVFASTITTVLACNVSSSNRFIVTGVNNNNTRITSSTEFSLIVLVK